MISQKALEEYKAIYKEEYGADISDAEALDLAVNLLTMMNAVYRPIKKEWAEDADL